MNKKALIVTSTLLLTIIGIILGIILIGFFLFSGKMRMILIGVGVLIGVGIFIGVFYVSSRAITPGWTIARIVIILILLLMGLFFIFGSNIIRQTAFPGCVDSDAGNNLKTKGYIQTTISDVSTPKDWDYCNGVTQVVEYDCVDGPDVFNCPSGTTCSDGACVLGTTPTTTTASCSDSDNGKNLDIKGVVSGKFSSGTYYSIEDSCSSTNSQQISEASCVGTDPISEWLSCSSNQKCSNGKCITTIITQPPTTTTASCSDSDGGENLNEKGYVSGVFSNGASYGSYDFCSGSSENVVSEGTCVDADADGYKESINTAWKTCPSNQKCKDGACVSSISAGSCASNSGRCLTFCESGQAPIGILDCTGDKYCCKEGIRLIDCPEGSTIPTCSQDKKSYYKCNLDTGITETYICNEGRFCNPLTGLCQIKILPPEGCDTDSDCSDNEICENKECVKIDYKKLCEEKTQAQKLLGWQWVETKTQTCKLNPLCYVGLTRPKVKITGECVATFLPYYLFGGLGLILIIGIFILLFKRKPRYEYYRRRRR